MSQDEIVARIIVLEQFTLGAILLLCRQLARSEGGDSVTGFLSLVANSSEEALAAQSDSVARLGHDFLRKTLGFLIPAEGETEARH
jgi:hypothetical protein